jgi:hypothetical protein
MTLHDLDTAMNSNRQQAFLWGIQGWNTIALNMTLYDLDTAMNSNRQLLATGF